MTTFPGASVFPKGSSVSPPSSTKPVSPRCLHTFTPAGWKANQLLALRLRAGHSANDRHSRRTVFGNKCGADFRFYMTDWTEEKTSYPGRDAESGKGTLICSPLGVMSFHCFSSTATG